MDFKTYQELSARTGARLANKQLDNIHMAMGMSTEAGELLDVFKKELAYGKEPDWINVEEEIGDEMWYIAGLCTINNLNFDKILEKNVQKLRVRYPELFTEEDANNRKLDIERNILEQ